MKLKGAEIICESLLREGVDTIFGYPGGAILPFYDALWSYPQLRHILVRHEQSAAHAADGYSRVTGKVGVCVATSGPGATNLVTGIMGAKADSVPMVAITGQVARASLGSEAFQECDICSIAASTTKKTFMVMNPNDLAETIREAFYVTQEGRPGPVLIDIPRDVQMELTDVTFPDVVSASVPEVSEEASERLKEAARLINEAERPLIISGHGVMTSGGNKEMLALAEKSGIPVITTLLGLGSFPSGHPLSMGMLGMHGMYWSNLSVDQADLIVGVGMRFDDRVTGKVDTFAPHARIIHMDIDPSQIGRNVPVEVAVVGDAKALLQELTPMVNNTPHPDWMQFISNLKQDHPSLAIPPSDQLQAQQVMTALDTLLREDEETTIVTGVGQHQMWAAQYLTFNESDSFVSSGGLGAMGFELPAALGVQVAKPGTPVWAVAGDGGFQMTLQELVTLTEEKLPVKIALINNGYLGMVKQWQEMYYDGHLKAVPVDGPDFIKLCEAYGVGALRVTEQEDVLPALRQAQAHDGPFLIEFVVDSNTNVYPMVPPGGSLADTIEDPAIAPNPTN
ncbi:MAG: biosynthetic-type acetolactate synthase large subunit [Chloroflexota bacterium]|jgi:acetolactate synthase-1/2/3 large subunit|nr:biosynthetic-type acetolactate synthase large subunit [Dehalococcoidia bacterium]MED5207670.1 biosynthetic-type acetolactate synthase large subunit [Chloroflexota bacterium]MEE3014228.1 biosynthetic-type acetolactate synthase large subunit [Chloroflexota bacterium]GIS94403.1 MAG: acetolactate synthase [Dehalococcoidia bacterium]